MFKACIVGRSNVGKTTIFNALVGRRIGLENDSYNTTRDVNEVEIELPTKKYCLISDTGGNTAIEDEASKHIHQSITNTISETDLVLFVVDARVEPTYYELDLVKIVRKSKKPVCLILNKTEGNKELFVDQYTHFFPNDPIYISAIHRKGINLIKDAILSYLKKSKYETQSVNPNEKRKLQIAIIGQTNVGKSSLINTLTKTKNKNLVLSTPHTTRDPVSKPFEIDGEQVVLIDTAGIFRKSKKLNIVDWLALLKLEQQLFHVDAIVYVYDATKKISHFDKKIIGMIIDVKLPFIICFNKSDLIDNEGIVLEEFKKELTFFKNFYYVFASALTGKNVTKVISKVLSVYKKAMTRFDENTLRFLINSFNFKAQFHMTRNRTRLINLIQSKNKGNHFIAYFKITKRLHFSIRRQLSNHISESLNLQGIPIKLSVRMKG